MATADIENQYELTPEQVDLRDLIRRIAVEQVAPRAAAIDADSSFPQDVRELFATHDLFGLPFDTQYGGTGTGTLMTMLAIEEVSKACASSGLMLAVQDLGTLPIRLAGSPQLKDRVLPRFASGDWLAAFALSEPDPAPIPLRCELARAA